MNEPETQSAVSSTQMVRRPPMTPERHRRALELYHHAAEPYIRMRCKLEIMMPLAFAKQPDGTLTKLEKYNWPEWAKAQAAALEAILVTLQERAFKDA
jgi:hypothetical protein